MQALFNYFAGLIFLITQALAAGANDEVQPVDIHEWQVPYAASRPRDPFATSATSVWFVGQGAGFLAHFNTESGEFTKVQLKKGAAPHNLIVATDGGVWYAGNRTGLIGRYDPEREETLEIMMPEKTARDPHTLIFDATEEYIWFTLQQSNMFGRLNTSSHQVDLIKSKTRASRPYGIKMAPDGSVWAVLFGTNKLVHIDPESLVLEEIELPRSKARPRRLEVLSDGRVWYVDYAGGQLGAYDPQSQVFKEWLMPQGSGARPYGMASDRNGMLWMVASGVQPNVFMGFNPKTESFFGLTEIASGAGTVRHMHYQKGSGTVWFGTDANTLGRAIVDPGRQ